MIFADASARIAIVAGEPEADAPADLLEADWPRLVSAMSVREAVAGLCRSILFRCLRPEIASLASYRRAASLLSASGRPNMKWRWMLMRSMEKDGIRLPLIWAIALPAPAPKASGAKLLFKGEDFPTDITPAG